MKTRVTAPEGLPFVDVERDFDAPLDVVFRAWTDPALLVQWLGPRKYRMEIDVHDVRDGGRYRYRHIGDDGSEFAFRGVFHGEQTPAHMLQTFEFEGFPGHVSLERLVLEDLGGGRTRARIHSVYQSMEARDGMVASGMAEGMDDGFNRLDELLAREGAAAR